MPLGPLAREGGDSRDPSVRRPADTEPETPGGVARERMMMGPSLTTRADHLAPARRFAGPFSFYSKTPASDQPEPST